MLLSLDVRWRLYCRGMGYRRFMRCCLCHVSPEVEKCKDEYPYQVHEVPIKPEDLDDLVLSPAAGKETASSLVEVPAPNLSSDPNQEDHADRYMRAVKSSDHDKR